MLDIQPSDLGFDEYSSYRINPATQEPVQAEAIEFAATVEERVCAMCIPWGVGKSLVAMSVAKLMGLRTAILTGTIGLQDQYKRDFERHGLVEIKGRSRYQCQDYTHLDCREGSRIKCIYCKGQGCSYEIARDTARKAQYVNANYAYWMTMNDKAGGLELDERRAEIYGANPIELLVLDEGHTAHQWLENYVGVKLFEGEVSKWVNAKKMGDNLKEWKAIADIMVPDLEVEIAYRVERCYHMHGKRQKRELQRIHKLELLLQKAKRIRTIEDDWVVEKFKDTWRGRMWAFDVVWPGRYSESYLFCGVPKIIIMSATLRPKTLSLLGVKKGNYAFREWGRVFPTNRHPIYNIPASKEDGNGERVEIRIDRKTKNGDLDLWVRHIDKFIDARLDRRGIIHSVSYDRQQYLIAHSRHGNIMLGNTADPESATAVKVAQRFREREAPVILVSPSFGTGWNFPFTQAEYIIICKVPFQQSGSKVQKARKKNDPSYGFHMAMQELEQMVGRGMRDFDDRCEVAIMDAHANWFLYKHKHLASSWFVGSVRKCVKLPEPAPKL